MTRDIQYLVSFSCGKCGSRLGWVHPHAGMCEGAYCDSCAEEKDEEIERECETEIGAVHEAAEATDKDTRG